MTNNVKGGTALFKLTSRCYLRKPNSKCHGGHYQFGVQLNLYADVKLVKRYSKSVDKEHREKINQEKVQQKGKASDVKKTSTYMY